MAATEGVKLDLGDIKLGIATWNVGNANPLESFEKIWPNRGEGYDICVQGLQESTYTDKAPDDEHEDRNADEFANEKADADTKTRESEGGDKRRSSKKKRSSSVPDLFSSAYVDLQDRLLTAFNGSSDEDAGEWTIFCHSYRADMQMYVLVRKSLEDSMTNLEERVENTGILHLFPNKGGILVSFDFHGTTLAFISTHLTAHEGVAYCGMRNDSIKEILGGVRVGDERFDVSNQKHHVFWMGDMNYRTCFEYNEHPPRSKRDENMTKEEDEQRSKLIKDSMRNDGDEGKDGGKGKKETKKKKVEKQVAVVCPEIKNNDWAAIVARDELNREIAGNRALAGFTALTPAFPPTFKRIRSIGLRKNGDKWVFQSNTGTSTEEVDPLSFYDKKRTPSYTDRILFRSMPGFAENCVPESFVSFEECLTSDHKPVRATFSLAPTKGAADIMVNARALELSPGELIAEGEGFEMVVTRMRGRNLAEMDFGGGSDPYMVATTDPAAALSVRNQSHILKTKYLVNDINPNWGSEKLNIPIVSCDVEGLRRNAHLYLSVWDYDLTNEDDLIGLARIPFADIFAAAANDEPYTYDEDVYENGEVCGSIQGEIRLATPLADIAKRFTKKGAVPLSEAVFMEIADCCSPGCTVA